MATSIKYIIGLAVLVSVIFGYRMLVSEDAKVSEDIVIKTEIVEDATPINSIVSEPVTTPIVAPVPKKPAAPVIVTTPESIVEPVAAPLPVKINHSGQWSGRFTTTKPDVCANYSGDWTLRLVDTDGVLTGRWTSTDGTEGEIKGSSTEKHIDFKGVYGDYVLLDVSFDISGKNLENGIFTRTQECESNTGPVSGNLTGAKNY